MTPRQETRRTKSTEWYTRTILCVVGGLWVLFFPYFSEAFIDRFYFMPFLGTLAATVANTTPAAAGIVYFPTLTRLQITPVDAVRFTLIIQAYGMGLGTFKWFLVNRKLFIFRVLPTCLAGGVIGVVTAIVFLPISEPATLSLIFNFIAFLLTQIIFFSILTRHQYPNLDVEMTLTNRALLFFFSILGGLISGWIGFGIDTMFYFILTVIFKINPAAAIVTSISLMAALSMVGTALNVTFYAVPLDLWYAAIPGVTVAGLYIASFLAIRVGPKNVLMIFTILLSADFIISFWLQSSFPISKTARYMISYALIAYLVAIHVKIFRMSYEDIGMSLGSFK